LKADLRISSIVFSLKPDCTSCSPDPEAIFVYFWRTRSRTTASVAGFGLGSML
jgi:hypothetical protein